MLVHPSVHLAGAVDAAGDALSKEFFVFVSLCQQRPGAYFKAGEC